MGIVLRKQDENYLWRIEIRIKKLEKLFPQVEYLFIVAAICGAIGTPLALLFCRLVLAAVVVSYFGLSVYLIRLEGILARFHYNDA